MAFNKKTWKARQGTGLNKFSIGGASPVALVNIPDSVTEPGDAFSQENMNDFETRVDNAFTAAANDIETLQEELETNTTDISSLKDKMIVIFDGFISSGYSTELVTMYTHPTSLTHKRLMIEYSESNAGNVVKHTKIIKMEATGAIFYLEDRFVPNYSGSPMFARNSICISLLSHISIRAYNQIRYYTISGSSLVQDTTSYPDASANLCIYKIWIIGD